jgi:hypothetical protein
MRSRLIAAAACLSLVTGLGSLPEWQLTLPLEERNLMSSWNEYGSDSRHARFRQAQADDPQFFVTSGAPGTRNLLTLHATVLLEGDSPGGAIYSNLVDPADPVWDSLTVGDVATMFEFGVNRTNWIPYLHMARATKMATGVQWEWLRFNPAELTPGQANCLFSSCAMSSSWSSIMISRSLSGTSLLIDGQLRYFNSSVVSTHMDTTQNVLNRVAPALIGARRNATQGTFAHPFLGRAIHVSGWALPLNESTANAFYYQTFPSRIIPAALAMHYQFRVVQQCDNVSVNLGSGAQVLVIPDSVGRRPMWEEAAQTSLPRASAMTKVFNTFGYVLPTLGEGDFAVGAGSASLLQSITGVPITVPVSSPQLFSGETFGGPRYSHVQPTLITCGFCQGRLSPVPDTGLAGHVGVTLNVPLNAGACANPSFNASDICDGVTFACRKNISSVNEDPASPIPSLPSLISSSLDPTVLSCTAGNAITGDANTVAHAVSNVSEAVYTHPAGNPPLVRLRWRGGLSSRRWAPGNAATDPAARPKCVAPFYPYTLAQHELALVTNTSVHSFTGNRSGPLYSSAGRVLDSLQFAQSGVVVGAMALPMNKSSRGAVRIDVSSSYPPGSLPSLSVLLAGVQFNPGDTVDPATLAMFGGVLTEEELRTPLHTPGRLHRLLRPGTSQAISSLFPPSQSTVVTGNSSGSGSPLEPELRFDGPVDKLSGLLLLDGSAWRGMLPIRYFRSSHPNETLTNIVSSNALPLHLERWGASINDEIQPGKTPVFEDQHPFFRNRDAMNLTDLVAEAALSRAMYPDDGAKPLPVPVTPLSRSPLDVFVSHFECDRSEPGWPRLPGSDMTEVKIHVIARVPIVQPTVLLSPYVHAVETLVRERIGLTTPPSFPFASAEPWMSDAGGWLAATEASVAINAATVISAVERIRNSSFHVPGTTVSRSPSDLGADPLHNSMVADVKLEFDVDIVTRVAIPISQSSITIDLVDQLAFNLDVTQEQSLTRSHVIMMGEAAHELARSIAIAAGFGESWAQRQRCRAVFSYPM